MVSLKDSELSKWRYPLVLAGVSWAWKILNWLRPPRKPQERQKQEKSVFEGSCREALLYQARLGPSAGMPFILPASVRP